MKLLNGYVNFFLYIVPLSNQIWWLILIKKLGTDPKKNKYGFSEHGPISFDPPTSEGFSEQNYSETW